MEILRIEQSEIQEEIQSNELLGHTVVDRVKQTAKRNEFDKFKLHVEAIEKITSLLLGLSGRLARAENALMGLVNTSNPQEKVNFHNTSFGHFTCYIFMATKRTNFSTCEKNCIIRVSIIIFISPLA